MFIPNTPNGVHQGWIDAREVLSRFNLSRLYIDEVADSSDAKAERPVSEFDDNGVPILIRERGSFEETRPVHHGHNRSSNVRQSLNNRIGSWNASRRVGWEDLSSQVCRNAAQEITDLEDEHSHRVGTSHRA